MMPIHMIIAWTVAQIHEQHRQAREHPERGDIVQTVIIIGLFAAAAITIVAVLVAKAKSTADNVQTQ
jgi:hypothetical protein